MKDLGDDNLGMLPIYIGVDGEENQGLCTGSENFWCVNNNSSDADIQATLDFLYWCVTSRPAPAQWLMIWALSSPSRRQRTPPTP